MDWESGESLFFTLESKGVKGIQLVERGVTCISGQKWRAPFPLSFPFTIHLKAVLVFSNKQRFYQDNLPFTHQSGKNKEPKRKKEKRNDTFLQL